MRPLTAAELLDLWEDGQAGPPVRRALALLAAACPGTPADDLARLGIGRRDRLLLELRERTFGPRLTGSAACPACGERVEIQVPVRDLLAAGSAGDENLFIDVDGWEVRFRLPSSQDVLDLEGAEPPEARHRVLAACLLSARSPQGEEVSIEELPGKIRQAMVDAMARAEPLADVELAPACPSCGHAWLAAFDIVSFFWTEIDAWARVLLHEVHVLAWAYGWREAEILALSPWRRRAYLEKVGG